MEVYKTMDKKLFTKENIVRTNEFLKIKQNLEKIHIQRKLLDMKERELRMRLSRIAYAR
jgi:hypothetical protein